MGWGGEREGFEGLNGDLEENCIIQMGGLLTHSRIQQRFRRFETRRELLWEHVCNLNAVDFVWRADRHSREQQYFAVWGHAEIVIVTYHHLENIGSSFCANAQVPRLPFLPTPQ